MKTNNPILVSGFEAFGHAKTNPSSEIVLPHLEEVFGDTVETVVLPVAFEEAASIMQERIANLDPAAVVMFGVSATLRGHRKISLEQYARNRSAALLIPDNRNQRRFGKIEPNGPRIMAATLPIDTLRTQLEQDDLPVRTSRNAQSFVCNELMYRTLRTIEESDDLATPAGFVHIGSALQRNTIELAAANIISTIQQELATPET